MSFALMSVSRELATDLQTVEPRYWASAFKFGHGDDTAAQALEVGEHQF
jgi:hypothetical protein